MFAAPLEILTAGSGRHDLRRCPDRRTDHGRHRRARAWAAGSLGPTDTNTLDKRTAGNTNTLDKQNSNRPAVHNPTVATRLQMLQLR